MINAGKLMKLAKGALSKDEFEELAAALGLELRCEEVPEDRKADAFQRVAQLSVAAGAEVSLITLMIPMRGRVEGLLVLAPTCNGRVLHTEKPVDSGSAIPLSLPQSA